MKDIWNDCGVHQVADMVRTDAHYQNLLTECDRLESRFCMIMEKLAEEDRRVVENYIAICEDLQYRKTQLAYMLNVSAPSKKPG